MNLHVDVKSSNDSEDVDLCTLYDGEVTSESKVKGVVLDHIDEILSGDVSSMPKSILVADEESIDRIAAFIDLLF